MQAESTSINWESTGLSPHMYHPAKALIQPAIDT